MSSQKVYQEDEVSNTETFTITNKQIHLGDLSWRNSSVLLIISPAYQYQN